MVGPFILRRLKENVLKDLPDKMEEIRFAKFAPEQRKLYDAQVTHMKRVLESEEYKSGKDRLKVLADAILSGESESLMNMSKDQLMELLG